MRSNLTITTFLTMMFFAASVLKSDAQESDHLDITATFKDSTLLIKAQYKTPVTTDGDELYFLLHPAIAIDTVIARGLVSYERAAKEPYPMPFWLLKFDKHTSTQAPREIQFHYTIDLRSQNHMGSDWIELNADKMWFPNRNGLNNSFSYTATLNNFPESYSVFSHPDAEVVRISPSTYEIRKTTPWFEVLVLAGKDMKSYSYDADITLYAHQQTPDTVLHSIGKKARNSTDLLNAFTGESDPLRQLTIVLRNTSREEIGFQFNRKTLIVTGADFNDHANLSHEIAHYWWSKANFIEEPWLNESLANYSMYQVIRTFDPQKFERHLEKDRITAATAIPVSRATTFTEGAFPSYYTKGAVLLMDLEERAGKDKMQLLLSALAKREHLTTSIFLEELEKICGKSQRLRFEEAFQQ